MKLTKKNVDLIIVYSLIIVGAILNLVTNADFFLGIIFFFGLPALFLTGRVSLKVSAKSAIFALFFSVAVLAIADYLVVKDNGWWMPNTIFSVRYLGGVVIEDFIYGFFCAYLIIIFYEHFIDKGRNYIHYKKGWLFFLFLTISAVVFVLAVLSGVDFNLPYAYFVLSVFLLLIPSILIYLKFPKLFRKTTKTCLYFIPLLLVYEVTAIHLDQWIYPGQNFIGWVELFEYRFPFEEMFFWIIYVPVGVLSYYEFFFDDVR